MKTKKAFTLIEVLLVVAIIGILAGIIINAINPIKQLGDARNAQRWSDVSAVLDAVYQYEIDNNALPAGIPEAADCESGGNEICKTNATSCTGLLSLSGLTTNEKYLISVPVDPANKANAFATGYYIVKSENNRITVCAPNAEQDVKIEVSN